MSHAYDWIQQIACGCWGSNSTMLCDGFAGSTEDCPTRPPIFTPDPNCKDLENYTDKFFDTCEWYSINDQPGCPTYGNVSGSVGFEDIRPVDACVSKKKTYVCAHELHE